MYEKRNYAIAMNSDILKYSEKSVYNKGGECVHNGDKNIKNRKKHPIMHNKEPIEKSKFYP